MDQLYGSAIASVLIRHDQKIGRGERAGSHALERDLHLLRFDRSWEGLRGKVTRRFDTMPVRSFGHVRLSDGVLIYRLDVCGARRTRTEQKACCAT